jgi:hypothetical protein
MQSLLLNVVSQKSWASARGSKHIPPAAQSSGTRRGNPPGGNPSGNEGGVLTVRTLDLVRLRKLASSDKEAIANFTQTVRESAGWVEVNKELTATLHGGPKAKG